MPSYRAVLRAYEPDDWSGHQGMDDPYRQAHPVDQLRDDLWRDAVVIGICIAGLGLIYIFADWYRQVHA